MTDKLPEIVERVLRFAGKTRRQVSNPCISANECITLANWIKASIQNVSSQERQICTDQTDISRCQQSFTENQELNHKLSDYASTVERMLRCSHEDGAEILRLRGENEALRKCAVKYLKWLNIKDPKKSLESDLSNPERLS